MIDPAIQAVQALVEEMHELSERVAHEGQDGLAIRIARWADRLRAALLSSREAPQEEGKATGEAGEAEVGLAKYALHSEDREAITQAITGSLERAEAAEARVTQLEQEREKLKEELVRVTQVRDYLAMSNTDLAQMERAGIALEMKLRAEEAESSLRTLQQQIAEAHSVVVEMKVWTLAQSTEPAEIAVATVERWLDTLSRLTAERPQEQS